MDIEASFLHMNAEIAKIENPPAVGQRAFFFQAVEGASRAPKQVGADGQAVMAWAQGFRRQRRHPPEGLGEEGRVCGGLKAIQLAEICQIHGIQGAALRFP